MPIFDFECEKCGEIKTEIVKYSKDMHKKLDKCECGAKKYKRLMTVSWGYTQDLTTYDRKAIREAEKLISK